jgi:hypothetical protein
MDTPGILKVSVLANGELLLNGAATTLAELGQALAEGAREKAVVWYYRGNAGGEPPAVAREVLKLITGNRLPVRLSSKPDFSDTVNPADRLAQVFAPMREKAAQGHLVVLRPDGKTLLLPAMSRKSVPAEAVASVERMLPSSVKRNVAVIGDTSWTVPEKPTAEAANRAIPFFGILMGFAAIGHAVWIFNSTASAILMAGCQDADVLIVDSERVASLPDGWQASVEKVMRNRQILVHDRATHQLRKP